MPASALLPAAEELLDEELVNLRHQFLWPRSHDTRSRAAHAKARGAAGSSTSAPCRVPANPLHGAIFGNKVIAVAGYSKSLDRRLRAPRVSGHGRRTRRRRRPFWQLEALWNPNSKRDERQENACGRPRQQGGGTHGFAGDDPTTGPWPTSVLKAASATPTTAVHRRRPASTHCTCRRVGRWHPQRPAARRPLSYASGPEPCLRLPTKTGQNWSKQI